MHHAATRAATDFWEGKNGSRGIKITRNVYKIKYHCQGFKKIWSYTLVNMIAINQYGTAFKHVSVWDLQLCKKLRKGVKPEKPQALKELYKDAVSAPEQSTSSKMYSQLNLIPCYKAGNTPQLTK